MPSDLVANIRLHRLERFLRHAACPLGCAAAIAARVEQSAATVGQRSRGRALDGTVPATALGAALIGRLVALRAVEIVEVADRDIPSRSAARYFSAMTARKSRESASHVGRRSTPSSGCSRGRLLTVHFRGC